MEDIVAVEVELATGEKRYFLTWGRIQDAIDPTPLEMLILRHSARYSLGGAPVAARVCETLHSACTQPYFYECFFQMCREAVPPGPDYQRWITKIAQAMHEGRQLWYLGAPPTS